MTSVPAGIAAESSLLRQNVTLSVIKQASEQQQALVQIIDQAARTAPASSTRGSNLNTSV